MAVSANNPLPTVQSHLTFQDRIRRILLRRAVLWRLVTSDLKVKYEGSILGYVWSVLEPLLLTAVYFFAFTLVGRFGRVQPYALFIVSGVLPWQWVNSNINGAMSVLRGNRKLITKVNMPLEIYPISAVLSKGIEFLFTLPVLAAFAAVYRIGPSKYLLLFPVAFMLQITFLTGVSFLLAAAATLLRDIERVIKPVVRALFWMSPVLYPLDKVLESHLSHTWKTVYRMNPVVGILDLYRAVWYPQLFHGWNNVIAAAVGSVIILFIGWRVFTHLEGDVLKEL